MLNCKECCFAKIEDGHQEKCLADKYKYLQNDKHIKTDNGIFTFDRPCLFKRSWHEGDQSVEQKIQKVRDQLTPNFGICIQYDNNQEGLLDLVNQIKNLDYPSNRLFIIFYCEFSKDSLIIHECQKQIQKHSINCLSVFTVEDNVFENETSVFKNFSLSTFVSNFSSSSKVDLQKSINHINKEFKDKLSECLIYQNEDVLFISSRYVSKNYLDFKDYSKMERSLLSQVKDTKYYQSIV